MDRDATTRMRLLEAAGEVFADRGFRKATVREIVQRADANLNAINYHFGDKMGLYAAVFQHAHEQAGGQRPAVSAEASLPPDRRLHDWVVRFLRRMLDTDKPTWFGRLMAREMLDPTIPVDELVEQVIRPQSNALNGIIEELTGERADSQTVHLCAISVVGQCVHFFRAQRVINYLYPEIEYSPDGIEALAEHVTRFSLAAMNNMLSREQAK